MKRLNGWDSLLVSSETPTVHQHTLKVAVVDTSMVAGEPSFGVFRDKLGAALARMEPLSYQLMRVPWRLHRPVWHTRATVDLDYHIRRVHVRAPGGRRALDELISEIASTPLDRSRPLWEAYYVEGVGERQIAVVGKLHHALADGVASANLLTQAMESLLPEVPYEADHPSAPPTRGQLLRFALRDHLRKATALPSALGDAVRGVHRLQRRVRLRGRAPGMAHRLRPPATFLNHKLTPRREFASASLPLTELRQASRTLGVTINDMVLAVAAGGLRQLLLTYDGHADAPIVTLVPAATDTSPNRVSGNALNPMSVSLPVQAADPLQRIDLLRTATRVAKDDAEVLGPTTAGRLLEYLPPLAVRAVFGWLSRRDRPNQLYNVIISNVPGPRRRGRLAGAQVSEIYSAGPLAAGIAMNVTVWSYADQLNITVLSDERTFKDVHDATDAFTASFAEIRDAARGIGASAPVNSATS